MEGMGSPAQVVVPIGDFDRTRGDALIGLESLDRNLHRHRHRILVSTAAILAAIALIGPGLDVIAEGRASASGHVVAGVDLGVEGTEPEVADVGLVVTVALGTRKRSEGGGVGRMRAREAVPGRTPAGRGDRQLREASAGDRTRSRSVRSRVVVSTFMLRGAKGAL
jgi:hypothetical protein